MGVNIFKLIELLKAVLIQLFCPWHVSLHPTIAYIGYFLYFLFFLWLLSRLGVKFATHLFQHFFIIIAFIDVVVELYVGKLLDEPLIVANHKAELNSLIKRFKSRCPFSKTLLKLNFEKAKIFIAEKYRKILTNSKQAMQKLKDIVKNFFKM